MTTKENLRLEKFALEKDIMALESEIRDVKMNSITPTKFIPIEIEEIYRPLESTNVRELKELLKLSSIVTKIDFEKVERHNLDNENYVLRGCGYSNEVNFEFQVEVGKPLVIRDMLIKFEDNSLKEELGLWLKNLTKKKDFQSAINGIAKYAYLISRMKVLLSWVKDLYISQLKIENDLRGSIIRSRRKNKQSREPLLVIHWKIHWLAYEQCMSDRFLLEIADKDFFPDNVKELWTELCSLKSYSESDIKRFWISIVDALNEEM